MTVPLDQWTEDSGLEDFRDNHVKIHLKVFGLDAVYVDRVSRLLMISLRQELREAGWAKR